MAIPWQIATRGHWRGWRRFLLLAEAGNGIAGSSRQPAAATHSAAFEIFVQQYERVILNYLWRMLGEEQNAYDLTQETFLRAWEHFSKIAHYDNPRAWLFRVATNLALALRARHRSPVALAMPLDALNDPGASDPARHVVESDLVRLTLQTLPPKQRAMLVLREVYGLSIEEIADVLAMSRGALKMALYRAREQFRVAYEREDRQP